MIACDAESADRFIETSKELSNRGYDEYFIVPNHIQKFIDEFNIVLNPLNCKARAWTIMEAVSIWHKDKHIWTVTYDGIEGMPGIQSIVLTKIKEYICTYEDHTL